MSKENSMGEEKERIEALNKSLDLKEVALKTVMQECVDLQAKVATLESRWATVKPYIEDIVAMWKRQEKP